tara:strand:+ start:662 stop:1507 length:846 start_codon:yes stop_codon:yes gene_type:complete
MTERKSLIWDETFPSLLLKGEGASAFLHGQTTADVFAKEKSESIFLSCWLSTKGILKSLLEIRLSNKMAEIVILSGEINSIRDAFESVIFPADKVKLEVMESIRRIQKINNYNSWKDSNCRWIVKNDLPEKKIYSYTKANKEELELWKLRQGIPSFGKEINGKTNPFELGLGDIINIDKGCYLGQEAMARLYRSKYIQYQLSYWEAYGESNDFLTGKNFFSINQDEGLKKKVGVVTSSIRKNKNFFNGLALIKTNFIDKDCFSENGDFILFKKPISFYKPF